MRRVAFVLVLVLSADARAYIEAPMTLGDVINQSNIITILRVKSVDKPRNLIVYDKVEDVKGKFPTATARHVITGQLRDGEVRAVLDWAEPGKTAVFFAKDGACETCIDHYWYQVYKQGEDLYGMSHGEPFLLRSYAGKADRLPPIVRGILEGREVITPAMEDNKELLHKRAGKVLRMKASLKILTYDAKRDFVGWGADDIRRIPGGTGFSHIAPLSRVDAEARHASVLDFDFDGKLDVCLASTRGVRLFQNQGEAFSEISLTGLKAGARSAAWGDHNADGKWDLLLGTADGPKLFTNLGAGQFRDDSALLPRDVAGASAAVWLDADADGRPDVLVSTNFNGLRLYRNNPAKPAAGKGPPGGFDDVSVAWGFGPDGLAAEAMGEALAVADVNGDGRPDFLFAAGTGLLFVHAGTRFELKADSGLSFNPAACGPTFVDFDADGDLDLFVPHSGKCKLFRNDGKGHFTDVIETCGDLARPCPGATSAAWGDFDNDGRPDLVVGCLRGVNRYFRNTGDGTFADRTAAIGLTARVFNAQAVVAADVNGDGRLDLVLANEGQESAILFGNKELPSTGTPLVVHVPAGTAAVHVTGPAGRHVRPVRGGDGRGQPDLAPRFVFPPGTYQVEMRDRTGRAVAKTATLATDSVRVRFDEATTPPPK